MSAPKIVQEVIEAAVVCGLGSAFVALLSCVSWVWAVIIYPPFDIWLAMKWVFGTAYGVSMAYSLADVWDRYG